MKNTLLFLTLLALASCKKEEKPPVCDNCVVILQNASDHTVKLTIDGIFIKNIANGELYTLELTGSGLHDVVGDIQSFYAHTDFSQKIGCKPNCAIQTFVIKQ